MPVQRSPIGACAALLMSAALSAGCLPGPAVRSFDVTPLSMCAGDSALLRWDVRGTPAITMRLADPRMGAGEEEPADVLAPDTVELTMVAQKRGEEAILRRDVLQFPQVAEDGIAFFTALHGDTLVAAGEKSPGRWGDRFEVEMVASASGRALVVRHGNRVARLDAAGTPSPGLAGTPLQGAWDLRSLLTAAERADTTTSPDRLRIDVRFRCRERVR